MRYFLSLAYDGTNYHGWQIQPNAITVQQVLNESLGKILRQELNVVGCGRTDTGVHASYFVLHFDVENPIADFGKFLYHLNAVLPSDISVYEMQEVDSEKHARFDAVAREYHYFFTKTHHPFLNKYAHRLIQLPDVEILKAAANIIQQNTDFESFCKAHAANKTNICQISASEWIETEDLLVYRIKADRFLRNMVRALTGTMLEIGLGKRKTDDLQTIFDAKDRRKAGMSVEPEGLFLTGVWYDGFGFERHQKLPFSI